MSYKENKKKLQLKREIDDTKYNIEACLRKMSDAEFLYPITPQSSQLLINEMNSELTRNHKIIEKAEAELKKS